MLARHTSWRCLAIFLCFCCMQIGTAWRTSAQDATNGQGSYLLGTATTGGTYHPVGVALSTLVKLKLLPEFDVDLTAVNTDGSQENIELLRRDDIQLAIVSALAAYDARTGTGQFADAGPYENLRAITTLWLSTDHFLVRNDTVQSGTIEDFIGLKGRPVSLGREDSGTLLENRTLMSALGVNIENDFDLVEIGYGESAQALAAGRIDGMSVSGGVPIGAVQNVFETLGDRTALLEVSDEQLALIDRGRGLWQRVAIPSETYPGQSRDTFTIGTPNILAVRADVDEEVIYQITKTVFEELEYLHDLHGATQQISLDNAVNNLPMPVHAGAIRYFEEKGVELPPPPVDLDQDLLVRYQSGDEARLATNRGAVSLFAGTEGDTSARIASELAGVLNAADSDVRLLATEGGGIGRNLTDLLYLKGVDTALVRADVLKYAQDQNVYPAIENMVNYISEMFPEEVHLLVRNDIVGLSDLVGKEVNIGAPGSGSDITASVVLSELGLNVQPKHFTQRIAIEKLEEGEIAGAFFVGGKPMPLLQQIEGGSGLKLLSLPPIQYFDSYRAADIHGHDYPNLMTADSVVPTIAVRTALLTYAWRPDSARYQALSNLTSTLFEHLLALHDDAYHPKWREVDPTAAFETWQRFAPATLWIDDNQGTARRIAGEGRQLLQQARTDQGLSDADQAVPKPADIDAVFSPDNETAPTAGQDSVDVENDVDAATVPAAPAVELKPAIEPASNQPFSNESRYDGSTSAQATRPSTGNSGVPTTGVNSPTF